MTTILETISSPSTVLTLGATTVILLGSTYYLVSKAASQRDPSRDRRNGGSARVVNGDAGGGAKLKELDRSKYPGGHLTIYYGSQTGTAQMFAKQIASEAESHGFCSRVVDLQDVVENEDDAAVEAARQDYVNITQKELDEEGALIRATLSHPRYRDNEMVAPPVLLNPKPSSS
eukprot:g7748.t1 g7748   contig26:189536-190251(+)